MVKFQVTAFAPGHITMIFSIRDNSADFLKKGSIGVGFSIKKGVKTSIEMEKDRTRSLVTKINGKILDAKVTKTVFGAFSNYFKEYNKITINHEIEFPVSAGFGASGAGALSTAFALNELLGEIYEPLKCGQIAHEAEVMNKTGLGDVIAQYHGGFEMRTQEGAPGFGKIKKLDLAKKLTIILGTWGILETKKVLTNLKNRNSIINQGENLLKAIMKSQNITLHDICIRSQEFSEKISLESDQIKATLKILNDNNFTNSGMVMLGNSFFTFIKDDQVSDFKLVLNKIKEKPKIFTTSISESGVKIL